MARRMAHGRSHASPRPHRRDAGRPDVARAEAFRPDIVGAEPRRPEVERPELLRAEPLRAEPLRSEPLRAEPIRAETERGEGLRAEIDREGRPLLPVAHPDATRPDVAFSDAPASGSLSLEAPSQASEWSGAVSPIGPAGQVQIVSAVAEEAAPSPDQAAPLPGLVASGAFAVGGGYVEGTIEALPEGPSEYLPAVDDPGIDALTTGLVIDFERPGRWIGRQRGPGTGGREPGRARAPVPAGSRSPTRIRRRVPTCLRAPTSPRAGTRPRAGACRRARTSGRFRPQTRAGPGARLGTARRRSGTAPAARRRCGRCAASHGRTGRRPHGLLRG